MKLSNDRYYHRKLIGGKMYNPVVSWQIASFALRKRGFALRNEKASRDPHFELALRNERLSGPYIPNPARALRNEKASRDPHSELKFT
jgi:hypothetical protein